ncbi:thiamine phosphate synthase [Pedobacter hartonius]|uniref:Thiamine-phosphate synthase n=1 Tax=Pedobacter hartonius TaxID=425514 RepID=A0A1H4BHN5_9SPHI|nr:thiamine phosphate synthase [Pedobacter hartonius]SEA47679.1 thiamine-phosphate diphosphorylase [Pedobacter hartonius]
MPAFNHKLYLVTDQQACLGKDFFKVVESAVKGGVDIVQIREKELQEKDFLKKTLQLKELLDKYNVPLIVNDVLSVAMHGRTAGIHVGNSDLSPVMIRMQWPESVLGYSLEHLDQLSTSNAMVADYIALSPVFATPTKQDTIIEWGLDGIIKVRSLTKYPLVAIGNVHAANAAAIIHAGANCLAVVSAICSADDPEKAAAVIRNEIEKSI